MTFDEDTNRNCVTFTGAEDNVVDPNENFTVILTSTDDVNLRPDTAVVTIVDQICKINMQLLIATVYDNSPVHCSHCGGICGTHVHIHREPECWNYSSQKE